MCDRKSANCRLVVRFQDTDKHLWPLRILIECNDIGHDFLMVLSFDFNGVILFHGFLSSHKHDIMINDDC